MRYRFLIFFLAFLLSLLPLVAQAQAKLENKIDPGFHGRGDRKRLRGRNSFRAGQTIGPPPFYVVFLTTIGHLAKLPRKGISVFPRGDPQ